MQQVLKRIVSPVAIGRGVWFDLTTLVRNNARVMRRLLSASLLLVVAAALPQWLWLGAHVFAHHDHAAGDTVALAKALVHGHEHEEGVPDHEHHLVPSPSLRQDTPRDLQAPVLAFLESPETGNLPFSIAVPPRDRIRLPGSGPPQLHLLCTLLI
jgi:hypothetical protein